jgi:flagellar protein FlaJ
MVYAVSIGVAVVVFVLLLLQGQYIPEAPYIIPMNMRTNNAFTFCILIALIPPAVIEYNNAVWLKQIDKNLPRLLRDVTESIRSGMPLIRALEIATTRDYGPMTKLLETAMVNFNLTSDLDGSLNWLGENLIRLSGKRMATILLEAERSGGRMLDVLETSITMFTSLDEYRDEREGVVGPYVLMVYVSSLIFLFVGWVIITQFLTPLAKTDMNIPGVATLIGKMLPLEYYKAIIFWAAVMEGLIGGLVAGKIADSKVASGLIHSVLLITITIVFYALFIV